MGGFKCHAVEAVDTIPSCLADACCAAQMSGQPFHNWLRAALRGDTAACLVERNVEIIKFLQHQRRLQHHGCVATAQRLGLRAEAVSGFVPNASDPGSNRHVFAYNVKLTNTSSVSLRVVGLQHVLEDAGGDIAGELSATQPEASGVMGLTPCIRPGQSFEFGSAVMLRTPMGAVSGNVLIMKEPNLQGDDLQMHDHLEEADLMVRYAYYRDLPTPRFTMPWGMLFFNSDVPVASGTRAVV